jgi:hypothetical protein
LPPGAGRFINKIADHCQLIVPIGVYEKEGSLCLHFGRTFKLERPVQPSAEERDQAVSKQVWKAIAECLPMHLRGECP